MYIPLGVKTDYSLLNSLIKVKDLINFLSLNNYDSCGIIDDNMSSSIEFYNECIKNSIKPIIGLSIVINDKTIYLYAKNYDGLKELFKINTYKQQRDLLISDLIKLENIIIVLPYESYGLTNLFNNDIYLSYKNELEKKEAILISNNIVFINEIYSIYKSNLKYLDYLKNIGTNNTVYDVKVNDYIDNYLLNIEESTTNEFIKLINIEIKNKLKYIPKYNETDSYLYLTALAKKGLEKRLVNSISDNYINRLKYELDTINKMGFCDYFLIVYDYVKYAKSNNILVGPGRGSAAGSLVSYCLGITEVDPIKYDLLFERFLNKDRVTMPDIDIDFEFTKRDEVVNYVKNKYGINNVAPIITYGTLGTKQVLRDTFKLYNIDEKTTSGFLSKIDSNKSILDNIKNPNIDKLIKNDELISSAINLSKLFEGLKKYTSIHAAGVVISSVKLDDIIPITIVNNNILTGYTMEYLENLGLIKMDFLALKNLTILSNIMSLDNSIKLSNIPLDDKKTFKLFSDANTDGVFQFESSGMKNFIRKLKPSCFNDLIASLALFRPGPMSNIDTFIKRKEGKEKVIYLDPSLEPILNNTYGIIVYQEQIIEILKVMAGYSYSEADLIRRAMSKKKHDVMESERDKFINGAIKLNHDPEVSNKVYDLIIKFAEYGFNKSHSVSYALIGYYLAYLKANYTTYFILVLLNMTIGSEIKTKDYIDMAKKMNISVLKPNINLSSNEYILDNNSLLYPLSIIKSIGSVSCNMIIEERNNGLYLDFFDFVKRTYKKGINKKVLEVLINADALSIFNYNHNTLINNIESAINYADLSSYLDESLINKPEMIIYEEYPLSELISKEYTSYGFYISNHPVSKYNSKTIKLNSIKNYFDKIISIYVMVTKISKIKTKNNDDMAFLTGEDETDNLEFIVFKDYINELNDISSNDIVYITGKVTRRFDKYQIIVNKINKI